MTLTQATFGTDTLLKKALLVLGGSALIAVAAQISVPFFPVPMTMQTLAILFSSQLIVGRTSNHLCLDVRDGFFVQDCTHCTGCQNFNILNQDLTGWNHLCPECFFGALQVLLVDVADVKAGACFMKLPAEVIADFSDALYGNFHALH